MPPLSARRSLEHERAFRRWSHPSAGEVEASPDVEGPASFRVYSPDEVRSIPLRPSHAPSSRRGHVEAPVAESNPRTLARWLGIGMAIGTLGLTAVALLVALTDEPHARHAGSAIMSMVAPAPVLTAEPAAPAAEAQPTNDFELPDDGPSDAPRAKTRAKTKKARLAVRDVPF